MNIIIGQDKSVRITQYSSQSTYNIEDIKFYVAKGLSFSELILKLKQQRSIYPFLLSQTDCTKNYNIFSIQFTQSVSLKERPYTFVLSIDNDDLEIGEISLNAISYTAPIMTFNLRNRAMPTNDYGLTDADEPVDIQDRTIQISSNRNRIVAEDNISQLITFRMPRFYEGVDLTTKNIYVDYIPSGESEIVSQKINYISSTFIEGDENTEYILIPWVIEYNITKKAGTLSFAISIIDNEENLTNEKQYVWQTLPASLTISNNLGKRQIVPVAPGDSGISETERLYSKIAAIEELTSNDVDVDTSTGTMTVYVEDRTENISIAELLSNNSNQEEIILSGGGAPI